MIGYQYLVEIDALDQATHTAMTTLRFCCGPSFAGGGYSWVPRIADPGLLKITLFSGAKTTGKSSYSYGEIVLSNAKNVDDLSGPLDTLIADYDFNSRPVRMYFGPVDAVYPSGFTLGYTSLVAGLNVRENDLSLSIRGMQTLFEIPSNLGKFLGNNVAPDGLEGDSSLKDKMKPVLFGRVAECAPVLCNSSKLIYMVSVLPIAVDTFGANIKVYDNGVELAFYQKVADIENDVPKVPPGYYTASENGYIRLGSRPVGTITGSFVSRDYAISSHPKNIATLIMESVSPGTVDAGSFTAFTDKYERGAYFTGEATAAAVIDQIVAPLGYWYFNAAGKVRFGTITEPSTMTPVYTAKSDVNITKFSRAASKDTKDGIPAKAITLQYAQNYAPNGNPTGYMSVERKARMKEQFYKISANATVQVPNAEEMLITTAHSNPPMTALYAMNTLHTVDRELITIEIIRSEFLAARLVQPGECIHLDLLHRYEISNKHFIVVDITHNYVTEVVTWVLWG